MEDIAMKKETTRRKFLCDAGAMCLFGAYGWWRENPPAVKKKFAICSKKLSMHGASEAEIEKLFKDTEPLLANIGLTTIVKIIHIDSYEYPGSQFQVSVDCKGLDSWGTIQNICMEFFPGAVEQRDKIVEDLKADSIFLIKGEFMLEDTPVTFYEPDYSRIKPKSLENKMIKLFQRFEDLMKIKI
jgi:hypothetical protein